MFLRALLVLLLLPPFLQAADPVPGAPEPATKSGKAVVYVIPVRDEIATPVFYILRRGLKEAIARKADAIVLDMETPGGRGDVMLEMMEALDKFQGDTITYVNSEAGSAGAIIAAITDEIYFAPKGVMGAAEVVLGTGQDVPEALKRKITSYINAKIRAFSTGDDPRRADVLKAMMTPDFELKLDGKVLKPKGELLTITAEEAITLYGEPPTPLLAAGIAADLDALLDAKFGPRGFEKIVLEVTWSEHVARFLDYASPVLMGLGLLALFIEFKTPGFGWAGASGIILMLLVFFGHYTAGLSGHEPAVLFGLGVLLVAIELLFFPGTAVAAVTGVMFMLVSLLWAGADLWPNEPMSIGVSGEIFLRPALELAFSLVMAGVLFALFVKYLPKSSLYGRLAVQGASATPAQLAGLEPRSAAGLGDLVGRRGVAVTALFPSGEVEVEGRRFQAKLDLGFVEANTPVIVTGQTDFGLTVEKAESS
jgi:membrane-bound serine protease (ClpP class)